MNRKAATVAAALVVATFLLHATSVAATITGDYNVVYSATGMYDVGPGQTRVIDEVLSVTYTNGSAVINYYLPSLPYGIDHSILYLSPGSRSAMVHDVEGIALSTEDPSNPFLTYFGCPLIVMVKTTDEYKLTVKWQLYEGFAVYVEIEKLNEMQKIVRISYQGSNIDLYTGLDEEDKKRIESWKFMVSPAGIATMAIPFILVIIFICYISSTKKKIRTSARGGRFLTR